DPKVRDEAANMEKLPISVKQERVDSALNRLQRFAFGSVAIQRVFEQRTNVLDVGRMLDRGEVLVGDLSLLPSTEAQSLVGATLANLMYHTVKRRPAHKRSLSV